MRPIEYGILPDDSDYFPYQPSTIASKVYLYPVALGRFHYQSGYRLKRSSYNSFLLMYIEKGSCQVYHPDQIGTKRQPGIRCHHSRYSRWCIFRRWCG